MNEWMIKRDVLKATYVLSSITIINFKGEFEEKRSPIS